jgi:hypothetical protein
MICEREGTTMNILKFTFKLLKHGSIFLLRAFGILAPIAGSFVPSAGAGGRSMADFRHASLTGHFSDGTPERWEYKDIYVEDDVK